MTDPISRKEHASSVTAHTEHTGKYSSLEEHIAVKTSKTSDGEESGSTASVNANSHSGTSSDGPEIKPGDKVPIQKYKPTDPAYVKVDRVLPLEPEFALNYSKLLKDAAWRWNYRILKETGKIEDGDSDKKIKKLLDDLYAPDIIQTFGELRNIKIVYGDFYNENYNKKKEHPIAFVASQYPNYIFINNIAGEDKKELIFNHELVHILQYSNGIKVDHEPEKKDEYKDVEDYESTLERAIESAIEKGLYFDELKHEPQAYFVGELLTNGIDGFPGPWAPKTEAKPVDIDRLQEAAHDRPY